MLQTMQRDVKHHAHKTNRRHWFNFPAIHSVLTVTIFGHRQFELYNL